MNFLQSEYLTFLTTKHYFILVIDAIEGMAVMVSDQQRAVDFYTQHLGFEKKVDTDVAGYRWVVVGPKHDDAVISLITPTMLSNSKSQQTRKQIGTNTGIWLYTRDIDLTYEELKSRHVNITMPKKQIWGGMMCQIHDQDDNIIGLVGDCK